MVEVTIEQKAREIADEAYDTRGSDFKWQNVAIEAARLGIIEGLEMALATSQEVIDDMRCSDETDLRTAKFRVATAIRALIEEQKA